MLDTLRAGFDEGVERDRIIVAVRIDDVDLGQLVETGSIEFGVGRVQTSRCTIEMWLVGRLLHLYARRNARGLHKVATIRFTAPAYWKFESIPLQPRVGRTPTPTVMVSKRIKI